MILINAYFINVYKICFIFEKLNKLQAIQSTSDGTNCKQEILLNGESIWSRSLRCPGILTETQYIYFSGSYGGHVPDAEIRNLQFFTYPV